MNATRVVGLAAFGCSCALVGAAAAWWWSPAHHAASREPAPAPQVGDRMIAAPSGRNGVAADSAARNAEHGNAEVPATLLRRLAALKNVEVPANARELVVLLQQLRALGPAALPAVGEYLRSGADVDFRAAAPGLRPGKLPGSFTVPPSLRLGLLDVVKDIGGAEAERILAGELRTTGRGVEVAYLSQTLQQLAPDKYRDVALGAARDLLAMPLRDGAGSPLDRGDRDYVYGVLGALGDTSFTAQAGAELIRRDGRIEPGALHYLQQTLKADSLDAVAQAWQDPRVPAVEKEPLARAALNYVGASDRADALYRVAITEPAFSGSQRQNLIEDLNEAGFADPRHIAPSELPLVLKRLALIEELAPRATDPTTAAAFKEAYKDLVKIRDDLVRGRPGR